MGRQKAHKLTSLPHIHASQPQSETFTRMEISTDLGCGPASAKAKEVRHTEHSQGPTSQVCAHTTEAHRFNTQSSETSLMTTLNTRL